LFSWLSEASNTTIVENNILNNFITAVTIRRGDNNTISHNKIENNSFGIYLDDSAYNVVSENSINGTSYNFGIEIDGSNNLIFRNNITNTYYGINESGSYNTVSENNITDSENGICITDAGHSTFNRNNVTHNYNGFNIWSRYNIIHENNIEDNSNGVVLCDGTVSPGPSIGNTFFHNDFVNNTVQVSFHGSEDDENFWDNGAEGNFWSDYTGADNNNDGIGDTPHILSESNIDRYPLMSPFGDPSPVVPEFPSSMLLPIFTITTLIMALAYFKKRKH
jgi:parallel beta-helix repeat protein